MCVLFEKKGHIAYVKLNRPEAKNAFSPELIFKVGEVFDRINADNDLWVVIVGSSTPGIFSAGADLKLLLPLMSGKRPPADEYDRNAFYDRQAFLRGTLKYGMTDRPIIAAIDGHCYAGGFEAVMGSDIRVASERSMFGLPEVKRGVVAWGGGISRLASQIPLAKAMEMNLTGEPFSAQQMLELGFLNAVVPSDQVWQKAEEYAAKIAENAPLSVRVAKSGILKCLGRQPYDAFQIEIEVAQPIRTTHDAEEGSRAFFEKRKPVWKGR